MFLLFQGCIFRFHVNFRGCTWSFLLISLDDWFPKVLPKGWSILWQFKLKKHHHHHHHANRSGDSKKCLNKNKLILQNACWNFCSCDQIKKHICTCFWFSSLSTFTVKINTFLPSNISALHKILWKIGTALRSSTVPVRHHRVRSTPYIGEGHQKHERESERNRY